MIAHLNMKRVPGKLRAATAELRDELRAEGLIEPPRMFHVVTGGFHVPGRGYTADERAAIDAFMATKGPRQYPANDSADDFNLCVFLRSNGYKVQRNCSIGSRRAPFFIDEKGYTRAGFIAFVNRVRASLNRQPIGIPA